MTGDTMAAGATALTPELATSWTEKAQPGAELCYVESWHASAAGEEVNERLHELVAQGYLYFKRRPIDDGARRVGFRYLVERSSRPWGKPLKVVR